MSNLMTIKNVRGYIENDVAYLNLEDVARGLGFTTVATSGNECVRWARVEQYLTELGFNENNGYLPDNTFIPENIFYRLAMKAKNETAEKFQAMVADEILPSIRKTGVYVSPKVDSKMLFQIAQALEAKEKENLLLNTENKLLSQETLKWTNRKTLEAIVKKLGGKIGYSDAWREFKKELLYKYSINLNSRLTNHLNESGKKTPPKTLDMLHNDELPSGISTSVALCRHYKVDISEILSKGCVS